MKQIVIVILALLGSKMSFGQQQFSLEQAIKYGQENSPQVKIAQIGLSDADQQIILNRAIGLPRITGGVNFQHFLQLPTSLIPAEIFGGPAGQFAEVQFGTKNSLTASLQLQTLVFDASYFTALEAARQYRTLTGQQLDATKQTVKKNVTLAYLATMIYDESIGVLDSNIRNLKQLLFETEEMQKAGFAEILDIDRLKLSIKQLSSQQGSLARQKQMAVNNLKFLMGFPIAQELQLTESLQNLALNGFATEVNEKLLLDNRAEYNALQSTIALNELNVKAQKQMAYYPSLAGFATYQQGLQTNKFDGNGSWFPTALIGLQLNVPIFDGFAREAKIERAKLDMEELVRSRDQLVESIHLEVENARIKYVSAVEQVTNAQESLEMAKRIYQTATIKYKGGVGSSLEINQAEGGLFAEQGKYIQALFGLLMAKAELEIALGK